MYSANLAKLHEKSAGTTSDIRALYKVHHLQPMVAGILAHSICTRIETNVSEFLRRSWRR